MKENHKTILIFIFIITIIWLITDRIDTKKEPPGQEAPSNIESTGATPVHQGLMQAD